MKKTYVLDTNILLDSPNAIFGFEDNTVAVTATTLQELDAKKTAPGELGFNAREVCRIMENLRTKGDLLAGIRLWNGGTFKIVLEAVGNYLPKEYDREKPDNKIINTVLALKKSRHLYGDVILVTNDISMRINASVCGLSDKVELYKNDHISSDEVYTGRCELETSVEIINQLYADKEINVCDIPELNGMTIEENEFFTLKSDQLSVLAVHQGGVLKYIDVGKLRPFGVTPRNAAQIFGAWALIQPAEEIPLVIFKGPAGTAKTFLALAAGLECTYGSRSERWYDSVLISRNNVMADADFGALPGDLQEKMNPLLAPFYDNLEELLRKDSGEERNVITEQIVDMFDSGVIEICALAYIRGRSISHKYLIVDEAQNATRSQIRDIVTRAGTGTKVVLCGDPEQIDAHNLDKLNNGLVFAAEKLRGPLVAQLTFNEEECQRSELAKFAIKKMGL